MMETLLNQLSSKDVWLQFQRYKTERNQLNRKELKQLGSFIQEERYLGITGDLSFSYPVKKQITKLGSAKKRTVYSYSEDETWVLKLLAYLLYRYDEKISGNCYSFRRNMTAKTAFDRIRKIPDLNSRYVLKLDIHDYFNSIDTNQLLEMLKSIIDDDLPLYEFLKDILTQDRCMYNGKLIQEKRGAMAGVPLASFFANVYLLDLDGYFEEKGIPYFRYSDDMIIFFENEEQLQGNESFLRSFLAGKKLTLNQEKYHLSRPEEAWDFLGFTYRSGEIDLSDITIEKMQGKIRRKAMKLFRERKRKGLQYEKTARAMIRSFDQKFYDLTGRNDFTWIRFYFPVITSDKGLEKIDRYMLEYLRYLYSGRHYKGNYAIRYDTMKRLGYTPLKAEYYRWKKENELLNRQAI
ncbi:MAG: group II intron reverse transcriptase domain-containing protein [Erysipelotrichaceae bacterium]|nr:group II intron reverse transcriptase domain-containing protein [Erysipelotrichaceae bacterium]